MEIKPIAKFRSPFSSKFGIPKQAGLVAELEGQIIFEPEYRNPDFLRGMEGFDFLWLIWEFSANKHKANSPVVRPPILGGNEKVGGIRYPQSFPSEQHRVVIRENLPYRMGNKQGTSHSCKGW